MTDQLEAWGTPDWLPPRIARRMAQSEAAELRAEREQEAERDQRAERWHERNMTMAREQAERRGEAVSVMDLAAGRVSGRSVADILAEARAATEAEDAAAERRAWMRGETGEQVHVFVDEPVIHHAARSERARLIATISRRWHESRAATKRAAEARAKLDAELLPLQAAIQLNRPKPDPAAPPWEPSRRSQESAGEDIRVRYGGPVIGIR
jgi:hypothetical protein